jgi:hypothetical protein
MAKSFIHLLGMKTLFLIAFISTNVLTAQNLVPNGSFEDTLACPQGYPDLEGVCEAWLSYGGTCDYLNNCSSICGYQNQFGFQEPHSGNAYAGLLTYQKTALNSREHLGIQLSESLQIGTQYYISFYVCNAWNNLLTNIATDHIGALCTTYSYHLPDGLEQLQNEATIFEEAIVTDTIQWTHIFGSFIADSAYSHLVIGNFFDDSIIDTLNQPYQVVPQASYYYVDDVCLSNDSAYSFAWTEIMESSESQIELSTYPNPCSDFLTLKAQDKLIAFQLFDYSGHLIWDKRLNNSSETIIDMRTLNVGLYYLKALSLKGSIVTQIIKLSNP